MEINTNLPPKPQTSEEPSPFTTAPPSSTSAPHSAAPSRPPVVPISPVGSPTAQRIDNHAPRRTYTHNSQAPQTFIPPPPVPTETVDLESNPDALALKAAMSILQMQRNRATADMQQLQRLKERALAEPLEFVKATLEGQAASRKESGLLGAIGSLENEDEDEDEEDDDDDRSQDDEDVDMDALANRQTGKEQKWPAIPTPQNVVRMPPINWEQYAVMGESLDKLHADQVARPPEGAPLKVGADGRLEADAAAAGVRREAVMAAPYMPGKDKIEKKKGGKK